MKTAMQDLREDLVLTQVSAKDALIEIENQEIRKACKEVVRLTLKNIIKRIDDELLEMEKEQIIDTYNQGSLDTYRKKPKNGQGITYYNEKFKK